MERKYIFFRTAKAAKASFAEGGGIEEEASSEASDENQKRKSAPDLLDSLDSPSIVSEGGSDENKELRRGKTRDLLRRRQVERSEKRQNSLKGDDKRSTVVRLPSTHLPCTFLNSSNREL